MSHPRFFLGMFFFCPYRDGTSIVLSDDVGQIYLLNTGQGESQKDAKLDQVPQDFTYMDNLTLLSFLIQVGCMQFLHDNCLFNFSDSSSLGIIVPLSGTPWEMFLIRSVTTNYFVLM